MGNIVNGFADPVRDEFSIDFAILVAMAKSRTPKPSKRPVFDSIRKPTAPPSVKLGRDKPEEVVHPALRKTKHKNNSDTGRDDE